MTANIANADRIVQYAPNNTTGPFPVPFPVFDPTGADLEVTLNGGVVAGWTFVGTLDPGFYGAPNTWVNGSLSFDEPISGTLFIEGNRAPRRESQYAEGRGIPARDHNTEYNTLTAICREIWQRLKRTVRVPLGEAGVTLPPLSDRAGKYLGFDGAGNPVPLQPNQFNTPDLSDGAVTDPKVYTPSGPDDPDAVKSSKIAVTASGTLPDLSVQDAIEHFDETTARSFPTVADLQAYDPASPPAYVRTAGYHAPGDLGGALYRYSATEPTHPGKVQSADGSWWEIAEPVIRLKQLGAVDFSDVADLLEGIFPLRRKIIVDGVYQVSRQVSYDGPVRITGADDTAELHWPSTNTTGGLKFRPTQAPAGWWDYFEIDHVKLTTNAVAQWDAINIDWYDLDTPIPYFYVRARIHHNRIMGVPLIGQGHSESYGWANCIYLNFPFSVTIDNNYLMGAWEGDPSSINSFYSHSAVYVPDQSKRTLAYLRLFDNTIFNFQYGVRVYNMEGMWCVNNDFQVCWRAAWFENTISPVNQYRFFGNHIGVYETHICVINARQVLIEHNEISYRLGRTDGGDVSMIVLDGVYSGAIIGNSIRGNVFNTVDVGVDGILLINNGRAVGNTRRISIDGNQFQNLRNSIKLRQTATNNVIGPSNTYDNMMAGGRNGWQIFDNSCIQPGHMGSGVVPLPAGQSPALYIANQGAAALTVGREGTDGAAVTFTKDGVLVGNISVTGAATAYNTTSDYRLKSNIRDLDGSGEFIDALRPRKFEMGGVEMAGFIAHEFAEVSPMSVTGEKDAVDEHGNPIYQAMQASTSEVMAHIVAELQSLRRRLAKLEGGG